MLGVVNSEGQQTSGVPMMESSSGLISPSSSSQTPALLHNLGDVETSGDFVYTGGPIAPQNASGLTSLGVPNACGLASSIAPQNASGLTSLGVPNVGGLASSIAPQNASGLTLSGVPNAGGLASSIAPQNTSGLTSSGVPNADGLASSASGLTSLGVPNAGGLASSIVPQNASCLTSSGAGGRESLSVYAGGLASLSGAHLTSADLYDEDIPPLPPPFYIIMLGLWHRPSHGTMYVWWYVICNMVCTCAIFPHTE